MPNKSPVSDLSQIPKIQTPIPPPPPQERTQKETNLALAQAINNLNQRMFLVEIQTTKANAHIDILNKTIALMEKEIKFNEKKNE